MGMYTRFKTQLPLGDHVRPLVKDLLHYLCEARDPDALMALIAKIPSDLQHPVWEHEKCFKLFMNGLNQFKGHDKGEAAYIDYNAVPPKLIIDTAYKGGELLGIMFSEWLNQHLMEVNDLKIELSEVHYEEESIATTLWVCGGKIFCEPDAYHTQSVSVQKVGNVFHVRYGPKKCVDLVGYTHSYPYGF